MSRGYRHRKKMLARGQWDNSVRAEREAKRKPIPQAVMTRRMQRQVLGWGGRHERQV